MAVGRLTADGSGLEEGQASRLTAKGSGLMADPASPAVRHLSVRRLGLAEYEGAFEIQQQLVEERRGGAIGDTLLLVEHPPVITLGARNRAGAANVVASASDLARQG